MTQPNSKNPSISIITICYNNPAELGRTLASFAGLDRDLAEVIVVDGSPGDSCAQAVAESPCQPDLYVHGPDKGKYDAMNKGLEAARGRSVVFINSGDALYDSVRFGALIRQHDESLDDAILYGDHILAIQGRRLSFAAPDMSPAQLRTGHLPSHQATLIPAGYYKTHRYDITLNIAADTKLMRDAFSKQKCIHIPEPLAVFSHGGVSGLPGSWRSVLMHYREMVLTADFSPMEKLALLSRLLARKMLLTLLGKRSLDRWQLKNAQRRAGDTEDS